MDQNQTSFPPNILGWIQHLRHKIQQQYSLIQFQHFFIFKIWGINRINMLPDADFVPFLSLNELLVLIAAIANSTLIESTIPSPLDTTQILSNSSTSQYQELPRNRQREDLCIVQHYPQQPYQKFLQQRI